MVIISWTDWCDEVGVHAPPTNSKKDEKPDIKKFWNKTSKNIFGNKKQECPYYGQSEYNPSGEKFNHNSMPYPFYDESTCGRKSRINDKLPKPAVVWKNEDNGVSGDLIHKESYPCLGYKDENKICRKNTFRSINKGRSINNNKKANESGPCGISANSQSKATGRKTTVRFLDNESSLKCDKPKGSKLKTSKTNANEFENHRLKNSTSTTTTTTKPTDTNNNNSESFGKNCKLDTRTNERAETFLDSTTPTPYNCNSHIPSDSAFSNESPQPPKKKALQDTSKKLIKRSDSCRQPSSLGHHMRTVSKLLTNTNFRLAERKKHEGNECYKNKDYRDALKLYTEAIELCPECAPYYSNRSACYMMLGKYAQAISDAREAVRLDSTFVKGYLRIVKCHIALGDPNAALAVLRQATELDPSNKSIREEEVNAQSLIKCIEDADKAAFRKDFRMAIFHLDRALSLATGCRSHKITKAEYLIFLHRYADAQEIVNEILQFDSGNADAIYVRGMCLYYQNNHEAAFTHFQHVLRLAPDHKKAKDVYKKAKLLRQKKDEGNQAFNRGNLQDALRIYSEALAIDPNNVSTNSKLYCNRATVRAKLCNFEEAVEDVTAAINLEEGYVKAYLRRAKCYQELEKHEDAVRDYEKACKLDRNQENKRLLQEAKALLKRSKWKDYYKILGVTKTATEDEIKKSYKKMALQHHPDRHASASDKMKHEHELKFKEIGEAYTVLTDNKKKAMYDRGQDINDPDCGMFSHDEVDPNQIFQAFFNQSGSNAFGFGNGFPGTSYTGSNSNNFPGGFHFQFS